MAPTEFFTWNTSWYECCYEWSAQEEDGGKGKNLSANGRHIRASSSGQRQPPSFYQPPLLMPLNNNSALPSAQPLHNIQSCFRLKNSYKSTSVCPLNCKRLCQHFCQTFHCAHFCRCIQIKGSSCEQTSCPGASAPRNPISMIRHNYEKKGMLDQIFWKTDTRDNIADKECTPNHNGASLNIRLFFWSCLQVWGGQAPHSGDVRLRSRSFHLLNTGWRMSRVSCLHHLHLSDANFLSHSSLTAVSASSSYLWTSPSIVGMLLADSAVSTSSLLISGHDSATTMVVIFDANLTNSRWYSALHAHI